MTECPPSAAAVLGVSTPGWRREVERRGEVRLRKDHDSATTAQQRLNAHALLAEQLGAPVIHAYPVSTQRS